MNDGFRARVPRPQPVLRAQLAQRLRAAARSHICGASGGGAGCTAIYTLADPRDVRAARYVGQTQRLRRRFGQHVHTARLWLPDDAGDTLWWVTSPRHRPLYAWIRELHADGGRLPIMWVEEWLEPAADPRVAERATIMKLLAQGAELLNAEARISGAQLPLL